MNPTLVTTVPWSLISDPQFLGQTVSALPSLVGGEPLAVGALLAPAVGMGLMDRLRDDEDESDGGAGGTSDDPFGGGGEDFGGDDDDLFGGGADDDPFGGGDDGLGDGGSGGAPGLENRLKETESELESVSSTVSTVRSENEAMQESVEEIEENIRKLLEIYEMVTQGVNPFVDAPAQAGAVDDASLSVFEDGGGEGGGDGGGGATATEVEQTDEGTSFDDIKSEYEEAAASAAPASEAEAEEPAAEEDDPEPDATALEEEFDEAEAATIEVQDTADVRSTATVASEPDPTPTPQNSRGKPYLTVLADDYVTDLVVLEWLQFLVSAGDDVDALCAIDYYERIEWVDEPVAEQLRAYLSGFTGANLDPEEAGGPTALDLDHHRRSLSYISQLAGSAEKQTVIDRWTSLRDLDGDDGI